VVDPTMKFAEEIFRSRIDFLAGLLLHGFDATKGGQHG
jgi:hypothetical protein